MSRLYERQSRQCRKLSPLLREPGLILWCVEEATKYENKIVTPQYLVHNNDRTNACSHSGENGLRHRSLSSSNLYDHLEHADEGDKCLLERHDPLLHVCGVVVPCGISIGPHSSDDCRPTGGPGARRYYDLPISALRSPGTTAVCSKGLKIFPLVRPFFDEADATDEAVGGARLIFGTMMSCFILRCFC